MGLNVAMPDFVTGEVVDEAELDALADALDGIQAAWDAFTPTIGGWTLGDGTLACAALRIGKRVDFRFRLTFGATTTASTSMAVNGLPVAPHADWASGYRWLARDVSAGSSFFGDADIITGFASLNLRATTPFTWAAGDYIAIAGTYEGA